MNAKFTCRILRETEKALYVRQDIENREPVIAWVPRSQCSHISKMPDGGKGIPATITITAWILEEKGLIGNA